MKKWYTFGLFLLCSALCQQISSQSQLTDTPNASQQAFVGQTIGLTDVKVVYHRPAANDRKIWGELIPYGGVWRAGANDNTVFKTSGALSFDGQKLPAGVYGLHIIPEEKSATIIFSNNSTAWGSFSYNEAEDALRVNGKIEASPAFYEHLTVEFDQIKSDGARCSFRWADKMVSFEFKANVHEAVLASLRQELQNKAGFTWQGWNEAANYCLNNQVNLEEGFQWATRSVFMNPNPQNMVTKARLAGLVKGEGKADKGLEISLASLENDLSSNACTWKEYNAAALFANNNKQSDRALQWADKAVSMSANMTTMMTKAQVLESKGDTKKAEAVKKEAIVQGSNAELNNYGYTLLFNGKADEAIAIFKANTEKHPEDPNVWDSLGEGYYNMGKKEEAIKALKKSLSLNPPDNVKANSMRLLQLMGVEYQPNRS
ncbi:MAG TPA: DUF2911 domain-containing protein [Saprospiraceae bacterium]|nr:DUF2911 domain-containing protein [Saprospiraceae bacterium]HMQ84871.1 DUF2911 domain-containing protein [Saprospiraceae bacterium]